MVQVDENVQTEIDHDGHIGRPLLTYSMEQSPSWEANQ